MDIVARNNVTVRGTGETAMVFAHGFGCDQHMWRYVAPAFEDDYQIVLFDHVGAGNSDLSAFEQKKYETLEGYASDIVEIIQALGLKRVIFVGHSVAGMMGVLAAVRQPALFQQLILVSPSPSYINEGDYIGGFTRPQIDELLDSMANNHLGWSRAIAPVIMGNPDKKELGDELVNSFCRTDPDIAKHFARTTFLSDERHVLSQVVTPCLILQCSSDIIAPVEVGAYLHQQIRNSTFVLLKATGHCPNLSAPAETVDAIKTYLSHDR